MIIMMTATIVADKTSGMRHIAIAIQPEDAMTTQAKKVSIAEEHADLANLVIRPKGRHIQDTGRGQVPLKGIHSRRPALTGPIHVPEHQEVVFVVSGAHSWYLGPLWVKKKISLCVVVAQQWEKKREQTFLHTTKFILNTVCFSRSFGVSGGGAGQDKKTLDLDSPNLQPLFCLQKKGVLLNDLEPPSP